MTTDQILAQCDTIREISEKATAGPWAQCPGPNYASEDHKRSNQLFIQTDGGATIAEVRRIGTFGKVTNKDLANAAIIANSRTFAPSAAQALKVAIEALNRIRGVYGDGSEVDNIARTVLQQITEAF